MVWSVLGLVSARRARSRAASIERAEPVHGRPQRAGDSVDPALPPPGGQLFSVISGQGEAVPGEESLQPRASGPIERPCHRARSSGDKAAELAGLAAAGLPVSPGWIGSASLAEADLGGTAGHSHDDRLRAATDQLRLPRIPPGPR
jgi:hypothetical protein